MLPGVIEAINGDAAAVRIYAVPEYGSFGSSGAEDYPLHPALAIDVLMCDLGKFGLCSGIQRVVALGTLSTGDADLALEIRVREGCANFKHEREEELFD